MIPRISSMIAAPRMALPALVESLPSSFRVSTVIETDVAVVLLPEGADESSAVYFTVDSIGEADDSLLAVPDLSAYTEE